MTGKFFDRIFRRSAVPCEPSSVEQPPGLSVHSGTDSAIPLAYNEALAEIDGKLCELIREQLASRLNRQRVLHLDVFRGQLGKPVPGLAPVQEAEVDLRSLVESLAQWAGRAIIDMHEMVSKARPDWEGDVLDVFFKSGVNATNYDALILEEVVGSATATFDDALALVRKTYPSLAGEELARLRRLWLFPLLNLQSRWRELHEQRFDAVYRSWGAHQNVDSMVNAFAAMCRAHARTEAQNAIRLYRETLFPVVTSDFASRDMEIPKSLDAEALAWLRSAAFDGFAVVDAWDRFPRLARAYAMAWSDVFRIESDTTESAQRKGRERYARQITATDCEEQFAALTAKEVRERFAPLFEEVRTFYLGLMEVEGSSSRSS